MTDPVYERFLEESWLGARQLAASSDILTLVPCGDPPRAVIAHFDAWCYVKTPTGVEARRGFSVGFRFPQNYLQQAEPWQVLQLLAPESVYHPNLRPPAICLGGAALRPGSELTELIFRVYELVTYQRRSSTNPADPLNPEAAAWARARWPVKPSDRRPLRWRADRHQETRP